MELFKTNSFRNQSGWRCESERPLNDELVIKFVTYRRGHASYELCTSAQVCHLENGFLVFRSVLFDKSDQSGDFYKILAVSPTARCTESIVKRQHENALRKFPELIAEIEKHYKTTIKTSTPELAGADHGMAL